MKKENRRLRLGLLGCGPISQAAHLDAIRKARNADLYAICDIAVGLTDRLAAMYQPEVVYNDFAARLADPRLEAVVIAVLRDEAVANRLVPEGASHEHPSHLFSVCPPLCPLWFPADKKLALVYAGSRLTI